jgi:hypothetical protein
MVLWLTDTCLDTESHPLRCSQHLQPCQSRNRHNAPWLVSLSAARA